MEDKKDDLKNELVSSASDSISEARNFVTQSLGSGSLFTDRMASSLSQINDVSKSVNNLILSQKEAVNMVVESSRQIYEAINTEQLSKMSNVYADLGKHLSDSLSSIFAEPNYLINLSESLAQLSNALSTTIKNTTKGYSYWSAEITLRKHEWWPFQLYLDSRRVGDINSISENIENLNESLKMYIFNESTDDFLDEIFNRWNQSEIITENRKPFLEESIALYKEKRYSSCVALSCCQVDGIITDITKYIDDNAITTDKDMMIDVYRYYHPNANENDTNSFEKQVNKGLIPQKEKNQLIYCLSTFEDGFIYWIDLLAYLYNFVFTSDSTMSNSSHPCRNKICHGEQLNYNTQEHALKSIFVLDILFQLGEAVIEIAQEQAS